MINEIICKIMGHRTYNQSRKYDPFTGKKRKKPYYLKICHRCGKQERIYYG